MSGELIERVPRALAEATEPEQADLLRREVEAFIAVARKAPAKAIEVEWPALLRLRLDAWRRWGELLGPAEHGGIRKQVTDGDLLDSAETTRRERARKLAFEVPDDLYHQYRASENPDKLTLAGALRLVPAPRLEKPPPPQGRYRCIVIDPPWPMRRIERSEKRPYERHELDYPTMSLDEIESLPVADLADPAGCHIYLWVTHRFLPAGLGLLERWGVAYECQLTWVKNVGMTPFSWMYDTEHVLFGRVFRAWFNRQAVRLPANELPGMRLPNGDGSSDFLAFRVGDLPDAFVVARSEQKAMA